MGRKQVERASKAVALSKPTLAAMLAALPKRRSHDDDVLSDKIQTQVLFYDWQRQRPRRTAKQRVKFWNQFAKNTAPAIEALRDLLGGQRGHQELAEFKYKVEPLTFPSQVPERLVPEHWKASGELSRAAEVLTWAVAVATACEQDAVRDTKLKGQTSRNNFLSGLKDIYETETGRNAEVPYYVDATEDYESPFLDFVFPALQELDGIDRSGAASRIKRMDEYARRNAASGVLVKKKRGRKPQKENALRDWSLKGSIFGLSPGSALFPIPD